MALPLERKLASVRKVVAVLALSVVLTVGPATAALAHCNHGYDPNMWAASGVGDGPDGAPPGIDEADTNEPQPIDGSPNPYEDYPEDPDDDWNPDYPDPVPGYDPWGPGDGDGSGA